MTPDVITVLIILGFFLALILAEEIAKLFNNKNK
jgi:hypothetical protein